MKLNIDCTGVPKTKQFNVIMKRTVHYEGCDHIHFDSMFIMSLTVTTSRHSCIKAIEDTGIAAFGRPRPERSSGGKYSGGGGRGGGVSGWREDGAHRQPTPVQDDSSNSSNKN